jgi:hypothetical protein
MSEASKQCHFCGSEDVKVASVGIVHEGGGAYFAFCANCLKRCSGDTLLRRLFDAIGAEYPEEEGGQESGPVQTINPSKLPQRLYYIRGIIRNGLGEKGFYYRDDTALELLAEAYQVGVPIDHLEDIAKSMKVKTWTNFRDQIDEAIDGVIA